MKKIANNHSREKLDYEAFFQNTITNSEIYQFLNEHHLSFEFAMKYYAEFKVYQEDPENHLLIYMYDEVILQQKVSKTNAGIVYLDQPYFHEEKKVTEIDYHKNPDKARVIKEFLENPKQGLYLYANNGIGKTTLLLALANSFYQTNHKTTLFVFWPDFIERSKRFKDKNYTYINKVKYAPRLIIDDLGQESITSWSRDDILHSIIAYRLEKKLPTFFSSNYTIDELEGIYTLKNLESKKTRSIIQKIRALAKIKFLGGENLRKIGE